MPQSYELRISSLLRDSKLAIILAVFNMKIILLQIDKTDQNFVEQGVQEFSKRLSRYIPFETITIAINKTIRNKTIEEQKLEEEKQLNTHTIKYRTTKYDIR